MAVLPSKVLPATPWAARRADEGYGATASPDWREINWREHLHSIEIAGRPVNYVDIGQGDGPPVVFVHGLGGCWQNWLENLPRTAQERRALAMDLPGFGRSPMPCDEISVSGFAHCVEEFCERLGLGEVVLVGNSMGGFVTAEVAIQFPRRVQRLLLVSAAGISITNLRRRPAMTWARVQAALASRAAAESTTMVKRPRLRHAALWWVMRHPTRISPELLYEFVSGARSPGFVKAMEALLGYDFRERIGEIRAPTLIVWGSKDALVPVEDADEYERLIPNARKVLLDDTGHVPMAERPGAFNECLLEFIAEPHPAREPAEQAA